jgi:dsRNA-specific ribonuclease
MSIAESQTEKYKIWFTKMINYVRTNVAPLMLAPNTPNQDEIIEKLVSPPTYHYWAAMFTHVSMNPNVGENYEILEKIGDRVMNSDFVIMINKLKPDLPQDVLSLTAVKFLSKAKQKEKSDQLGLVNHVYIVQDWTASISEDLLEALFGCAFKVAEQVLGKNEGYLVCANLLINLYRKEKFDFNYKDAITKIKEIFEKMHWSSNEQFKPDEIEEYTVNKDPSIPLNQRAILTLRLTRKAIDNITKDMKLTLINGGILSSKIGSNKKQIKTAAYQEALDNLAKYYGITSDTAIKLSEEEDLRLFASEAVVNRMTIERMVKLTFTRPVKGIDNQYVQLIGVGDAARKYVLVTVVAPEIIAYLEIKKFLIKVYGQVGATDYTIPIVYKADVVI